MVQQVWNGIRNAVIQYANRVRTDAVQSVRDFRDANAAYQLMQEVIDAGRHGTITQADVDAALSYLHPIYEQGTRGLRRGLGAVNSGGDRGEGIYGERLEGGYAQLSAELDIMIPGWKERRGR